MPKKSLALNVVATIYGGTNLYFLLALRCCRRSSIPIFMQKVKRLICWSVRLVKSSSTLLGLLKQLNTELIILHRVAKTFLLLSGARGKLAEAW